MKEKNLRRGNNYIFAKEFTHKNGIVLFVFSKQLTIELVYQSISRIPPDNYAIDFVFPLYYAKDTKQDRLHQHKVLSLSSTNDSLGR